jgi:hypothetical protein
MARKNVKVAEVTHERLKDEQREGETLDDTIQRLLGIDTNVEDLSGTVAAYQPEVMRSQVEELQELISSIATFDVEVEDGTGKSNQISFVAPSTGITVANIDCAEQSYEVRYRDNKGEFSLTSAGIVKIDQAETLAADDERMQQFKEDIKQKVNGALRRWAE